jgi:hypothetical protein
MAHEWQVRVENEREVACAPCHSVLSDEPRKSATVLLSHSLGMTITACGKNPEIDRDLF